MKENKPPIGRPSSYTKAKGDAICNLIAEGKSLVTICKGKGMPHYATVMRWLEAGEKEVLEGGDVNSKGRAAFRDNYARARRQQAEYMAERLLEVAEEAEETSAGVQKARLISDNIKWSAAKLLPKKYGERLDVTVDASSLPPPQVVVQIINAPKQIEDVEDGEIIVTNGQKPPPDGRKHGETPRLTS